MITDHERFKNVADGVQSIVLSVAVVVGGLWTLSTFCILRQREQAELELMRLNEPPALDIQISATATAATEKGVYLLTIDVSLKNSGDTTASLDLTQKPLRVWSVVTAPDGHLTYKDPIQLDPIPPTNPNEIERVTKTVRPHGTEAITFATAVHNPGLYLLAFRVPIPASEKKSPSEDGQGSAQWVANKFATIPLAETSKASGPQQRTADR